MKRRAMKKWIPKDTCYCYLIDKNGKVKNCKWLSFNPNKEYQCNGYCKYLKLGDWYTEGTLLLWDEVKECSISNN